MAAGAGDARVEAQGRPLLRAVRPRLRDPRDARPAAPHVPDPHVHQEQVRPPRTGSAARASTRTSRSAWRRASARSPPRSTWRSSPSCIDFLDGDTSPDPRPARQAACTRRATRWSSSARPGCATRSSRCARRSSASRWSTPRRRTTTSSGWSTTRSRRRCRCSSCARAASSGRKGLVVDKVEDVEPPELVGRLLEQLYGDARGRRHPPRDPRARRSPTIPSSTRSSSDCSGGSKVRVRVPAARRQAAAAGDGHAERARGVRAPQAQARVRPQRPRAGAGRAAGGARSARSAAAHRVLRHLEPPGHRDRGVDGGDGGRPAEALRLPALQDPSPAGPGRLRGDGRGAHPPVPSLPRTSATKARAAASGSRTRRTSLLVDGGKGQLGVAVRVLEELGLEDIAWRASPSGSKRSTCRASPSPVRIPRDSEALYLLQQVRDEAHRFAITYHRQLRGKKMTRSVLDDVPGLGPDPAGAPAQGVRLGEAAARAHRRRTRRDPVAARARSAHAVYAQLHGERVQPAMNIAGLDVTIITGMSGAGRSAAADVLEDLGFFVIDNLPPALITKVAELARGKDSARQRFALVVDVRSGDVRRRARRRARRAARPRARTRVCCSSTPPTTCSCAATRRRRRKHPLAAGDRVVRRHRRRARCCSRSSRASADVVVDTSDLNVHELRDRLRALFGDDDRATARLQTSIVSFGYKHGLPDRRRPRVRLPLPAQPALGRRAAPAPRHRRAACATTCSSSPRPRRSSTSSSGCSRCCSPRTCARARRTCRSASAAPAAGTAASSSPSELGERCSATGSACRRTGRTTATLDRG